MSGVRVWRGGCTELLLVGRSEDDGGRRQGRQLHRLAPPFQGSEICYYGPGRKSTGLTRGPSSWIEKKLWSKAAESSGTSRAPRARLMA